MQPHEQRVVDEKVELDTRLEKLRAFFTTPIFQELDYHDQWLLKLQENVMSDYSEILETRIARFSA